MKNKDFREIQVSSSLLVVIFLGVLALGVLIFLLGVSVGKKQAVAAPTQIVTQQIPEPIKEPPVKPTPSETAAGTAAESTPGTAGPAAAPNPSGAGTLPAASVAAPPAAAVPAPKPAPRETTPDGKPAAETKKALYYVQVAAYTDRSQAQTAADKYKKQGYTAVVANPRPTDTKTWYRIWLGGYASRDRAVDLLAKLNSAARKKTDFRVVHD
ncbi:MAG: SPOR domain-containing protein [Acidobacteriota bacterium]